MRRVMVCVDSRATWIRALTVCEAIQGWQDLTLLLVCMGPLAESLPHEGHKELDGVDVFATLRIQEGISSRRMGELVGYYTSVLTFEIDHCKPDIVVSVTDRYESLAVAVAASLSNVHLAHIQGGEVSGSLDESMRHAISKLAHIHFPANQDSADRIIKMGEDPDYVFNVGCPATDLLLRVDVGEPSAEPYILVSYNPVTTISAEDNYAHMKAILAACPKTLPIEIIGPNHDPGSDAVSKAIEEFLIPGQISIHPSLEHSAFIRLMAHASVMVGNSSAGIREACYFGTPVVDVGIRQQRRACSANVLTVEGPTRKLIQMAIEAQLKHGRYPPEQPFGNGGAGERIAELLGSLILPRIQKEISY